MCLVSMNVIFHQLDWSWNDTWLVRAFWAVDWRSKGEGELNDITEISSNQPVESEMNAR